MKHAMVALSGLFIGLLLFSGIVAATPPATAETLILLNTTFLDPSFSFQMPDKLPFCFDNDFDVWENMSDSVMFVKLKLENSTDEIAIMDKSLEEMYDPISISKSYPDGEMVRDRYNGNYFNPFGKEFNCSEIHRNWTIENAQTGEVRTLDIQICELSRYNYPCMDVMNSFFSLGYNLSEFHNSELSIYLDNKTVMVNRIRYVPPSPGGYGPGYVGSGFLGFSQLEFQTLLGILTFLVLIVGIVLWKRKS